MEEIITGGYGIYFGASDERNVSKKVNGYVTNNIAEHPLLYILKF